MERKWISKLTETIGDVPVPADSPLVLGIGDDAAILKPCDFPGVVTVDMLTEGVDFILAETSPELIGRKALAVNLSDIAAMGAVPSSVFVAVALPKNSKALLLAEKLYDGMRPLLERYSTVLAGGDTNTWNGGLVISVTAIGRLGIRGPLLRSGARVNDRIIVTGAFGGSILGRHFTFEPRIAESLHLHNNYVVHGAMDVSDGLSLDLFRMAEASGLGAEMLEDAIPIHPDAFRMQQSGKTPLEHALGDGEDFELILAVPPDEAKRMLEEQPFETPLSDIGCFTAEKGLHLVQRTGKRSIMTPSGYEH